MGTCIVNCRFFRRWQLICMHPRCVWVCVGQPDSVSRKPTSKILSRELLYKRDVEFPTPTIFFYAYRLLLGNCIFSHIIRMYTYVYLCKHFRWFTLRNRSAHYLFSPLREWQIAFRFHPYRENTAWRRKREYCEIDGLETS